MASSLRGTPVLLRNFIRADLATVEPWFRDPDTQLYLGGPDWPRRMLEHGEGSVGEEFRGATQTGAFRFVAHLDDCPFGYVDCGTFDRYTFDRTKIDRDTKPQEGTRTREDLDHGRRPRCRPAWGVRDRA